MIIWTAENLDAECEKLEGIKLQTKPKKFTNGQYTRKWITRKLLLEILKAMVWDIQWINKRIEWETLIW